MEPWMGCRPVIAASHHFDEEQDPDPHSSVKLDPEPHSNESWMSTLIYNQGCGTGSALFWEAGSGSALEGVKSWIRIWIRIKVKIQGL